jgi:23S rRNA pseudouridine2605 synthase
MTERLQKIFSAAGIASRRKSEQLISAGRVQVNGKTASLGDRADPAQDEITLDGNPVIAQAKFYLALNKPPGYVTTLDDPQNRPTVMDLIDVPSRVYPVGRLDIETEGLLLFTNDGDFAERAAHPRYEVDKTYVAHLQSALPQAVLEQMSRGIRLSDGMAWGSNMQFLTRDRTVVELTIHDGRNRIVRRMFEAMGDPAVKLKRIRVGSVMLGDLEPGKWRELTVDELGGMDG